MDQSKSHRLGIVLQEYPKLTDGFVIRSVQLLEQMGYNLRVYALSNPHDAFFRGPDLDRIQQRVRYLPRRVGLLLNLPWALLKLLCLHPLSLFRGIGMFFRLLLVSGRPMVMGKNLLYALFLSSKHLCSRKINCLCCFGSGDMAALAAVAAKLNDAEFIFFASAGDLFTQSAAELLLKANAADFVMVKSEYDRQFLAGIPGINTEVYVFYPGIDLEEYVFPRKLKMPVPPFRLLSVGGMHAKNNLPVMLKALAILRKRGFDVQYTIVGNNHGAPALLRLADELGIRDCLQMTGMIGQERLLAEYRRSHLLLAGSRVSSSGDRHDWPDAVIEAMAMGIPVVAENNGAIGELLENEETGMLVEPDRPEAFADACQLMLEDDIGREMVIFKARLKIEGNFSHGRRITDLVDIFEENGLFA